MHVFFIKYKIRMSTRKQIEELITGYLSGNTNKEDTERLVAWIKESPDNLRYYQRLKNIWQVSHPAFGADTIQVASDNEKMMSRITHVKRYESRIIRKTERIEIAYLS